ncbi:hypothetical protein [Cetobacterium sp.]|uniref:hypothetical protein n=1 Tax=Cetobacterium sp. TaxID=2071632 RepID=UPI003F37C85A
MKKICVTCKYSKPYMNGMTCFIDKMSSPIFVENEWNCKNHKTLCSRELIKKISDIYKIERHKYNEDEDYVYSIDFDEEEGFCITTPIIVNGIRANKKSETYYDESDVNFLVNKLNVLMEECK